MQTRILEGASASTRAYVHDFIQDYAIPSFGVTSFDTTAKISDVLYIQKILSHKTSHPLLFVFYSDITHEAQNALLKTLEELPEYVYVFFCVAQASMLLSTICSRAKVIPLSFESTQNDPAFDDLLRVASEKNVGDRLMVGERLLEKFEKDKEYEKLLYALHRSLIHNPSYRIHMYHILKHLQLRYQLVRSNNVSFKMTLDMALLDT